MIEVATIGAKKYSPGGWKLVPNAVDRYTDAMLRHELDVLAHRYSRDDGEGGTGTLHAAQVAWNALARLQILIDEQRFYDLATTHNHE